MDLFGPEGWHSLSHEVCRAVARTEGANKRTPSAATPGRNPPVRQPRNPFGGVEAAVGAAGAGRRSSLRCSKWQCGGVGGTGGRSTRRRAGRGTVVRRARRGVSDGRGRKGAGCRYRQRQPGQAQMDASPGPGTPVAFLRGNPATPPKMVTVWFVELTFFRWFEA